MLEKFRTAKQLEIANLEILEKSGHLPPPLTAARPGFASALRAPQTGPKCADGEIAIIAEYKRASPSLGAINTELEPADAALGYAEAGANALSVLTEEHYFQGHLKYLFKMCGSSFCGGLEHNLPLLRKDFIFHPLQVKMSAATPASAILLIVRMLEDRELNHLMNLAKTYGLECVVEVFDRDELSRAQAAKAEIIQVNNRDLGTLAVDIKRSLGLAPKKRDGETWISASGIKSRSELTILAEAGYDAALIGSSLMTGKNPGEELKKLRGCDA